MAIVGTSLRKADLASHYDVILIGSGMAALTAGAILAKEGKRVVLLEQHYTAGGMTHTFMRKGYEWDVGVHYIGEVHKPHNPLRKVFDYVSEGRLEWAHMGEDTDAIIFPDATYMFRAGKEAFVAGLLEHFPKEEDTIRNYMNAVYEAAGSLGGYYFEKTLPGWMTPVTSRLMGRGAMKWLRATTQTVMADLVPNKTLASVLVGQWGDYGLPPGKSSFAMHAMVAKHYFSGGNYPVGGSRRIAQAIVPTIEERGGQVLVRAEVEQIVLSGGKATGVRLANGTEITADQIISTCGLENTAKLLPESSQQDQMFPPGLRDKMKPSQAHLNLYLGVPESNDVLKLPKHNLWIYPGYDHDAQVAAYQNGGPTPPVTYVSFPSAKDPEWLQEKPDKSTIEIIGLAPWSWFEKWQDTDWRKRPEDYEEAKRKMAQPLLESFYEQMPHMRDKAEIIEISTPLSTKHYTAYTHGEIYGLDHTPDRFAARWPRFRAPFANLFLAGQDTVSCGVGGAMVSGVLVSVAALGMHKAKSVGGLLLPG